MSLVTSNSPGNAASCCESKLVEVLVVATSTIALQSQLIDKDLPTLHRHSSVPFTFALLKGRSNYVCRAKLRAAAAPDALFEQPVGVSFDKHLSTLREFAEGSDTGDRHPGV